MAVEVTIEGEIKQDKREYPYVGRHEDGQLVFFVGEHKGVSLTENTIKVGDQFSWNEDVYLPLSPSESVTLRNV